MSCISLLPFGQPCCFSVCTERVAQEMQGKENTAIQQNVEFNLSKATSIFCIFQDLVIRLHLMEPSAALRDLVGVFFNVSNIERAASMGRNTAAKRKPLAEARGGN